MATFTNEVIDHIAHLARLKISPQEQAQLGSELNKILALIAEIDKVDTTQVAPLAHPYDEKQPLRADAITETNHRETFQRIAPQTQAGLYIVPAVIANE